jgi:hypothetical protein
LLEERLEARLGQAAAVRNTGVSGWDPTQYLIAARRGLARERTDLVLVAVFVGNDLVGRPRESFPARQPVEVHHLRWPTSLRPGELISAVLYPINDALEDRSHLFVLAKRQTAALRMRLGLSADELPRQYLRGTPLDSVVATTAATLGRIESAARIQGVPTLFFLIPESFQVEPSDAERFARGSGVPLDSLDLDRPNRLLLEALQGGGLTALDVTEALRQARQSRGRLFGNVDRHLNVGGNTVVAEVLMPHILGALAKTGVSRAAAR